jgi:Omp85 superfamily domain
MTVAKAAGQQRRPVSCARARGLRPMTRSRQVLGVTSRRRRAQAWGALLAYAALGLGSEAAAETPKRQLPDYDGRGAAPTTPGDVGLWTGRVLLSPIYFVTEYVIRKPLGALIAGAERARWPQALYDFFFFGPDHSAGFAPIVFVDFGFNPSVGLYAFWNDAGFKGNDLRFHGSTWGKDWLAGSFVERIRFRGDETLTLRFAAVRRPDHTFFGTGPGSLQANISRYGEDELEASTFVGVPIWRSSRIDAGIGVRSVNIYHGHFGGDASVEAQAALGVYPLPYGFNRGYTEPYGHLLAALDTRQARPAPGSGVRIEAEVEVGGDVRRDPQYAWIRWGGTAGAFWDVNGYNRVISLSITTLFADPLEKTPIPFTELVSLGGNAPMPGFFPGRLVDRSAAVATLHYRWPIWTWLDGSLQGAFGNVFGEHEQGFKPSLLRFSGALGIESVGSPDSSFELLVGLGSETFEHGGQIDTARVVIGTNRGF